MCFSFGKYLYRALILSWLATGLVHAEDRLQFDLPQQSLLESIRTVGERTGTNVLVNARSIAGLKAPALRGQMTADEAFRRLLTGSGLRHEFLDERTVTFASVRSNKASSAISVDEQESVSQEGVNGLKLARSDYQSEIETPHASSAAPADAPRDKIEEIVVTAQKREERLQDVPVSVAILSGEQLDSSHGSGLLEALASTPSVAISEGPQGSTTLIGIRGVNATGQLFGGSSPVGFYLDALPFGFVRSAAVPDLHPFDLERVEVLRGPQGTLYGASSLNGAVKVITKDPDLDSFGAKALVSLGSTDGGGKNYGGDMAANVPIVPGRLAARIVAGFKDRSGWIDTPNRTDVNQEQLTNIRLKLKAQATEDLSLTLSGWQSRSELGAPNVGNSQDRRATDDQEDNVSKFDTASLLIDLDQPAFSVSSATSYLQYSTVSGLSLDDLGLPPDLPLFDTDLGARTFAQEFLVNSSSQGPWRWSAGLFYRQAEENLVQQFSRNDLTYESESVAYFGQLTRLLLNDRLEITAGLRYFEDEVKYRDNPGSINDTPPYVQSSDDFDKASPKATITWHLNPDSTIYLSYAEGFRSGFSQFSTVTKTLAPDFPPAGPDELASYEVGGKGELAGGRITYEGAVYYIDWTDTQQNVSFLDTSTGARFPVVMNAGTIDGIGVDLMINAQLLSGLDLGLDFGWNDLAFSEPVYSAGQVFFDEGFRPPFSAEKTFGASLAYRTPPFGNGWVGSAAATVDYTSEVGVVSMNDGVISARTGDSVTMVRSSLGLEAPQNWTITAFIDNATNTRAIPANSGTPYWHTRLRPRTIGLQLEYQFR